MIVGGSGEMMLAMVALVAVVMVLVVVVVVATMEWGVGGIIFVHVHANACTI